MSQNAAVLGGVVAIQSAFMSNIPSKVGIETGDELRQAPLRDM
jgi:hypothetical protein